MTDTVCPFCCWWAVGLFSILSCNQVILDLLGHVSFTLLYTWAGVSTKKFHLLSYMVRCRQLRQIVPGHSKSKSHRAFLLRARRSLLFLLRSWPTVVTVEMKVFAARMAVNRDPGFSLHFCKHSGLERLVCVYWPFRFLFCKLPLHNPGHCSIGVSVFYLKFFFFLNK